MSLKIIFICHNETIVKELQKKYDNPTIIFVGNSEININNKNIIIARNLIDNIENERKLLTFTAWYLIIKNKLFLEYEYLCLLEYDVILGTNFKSNLTVLCNNNTTDIITFRVMDNGKNFLTDVNPNVMYNYIKKKGIVYNVNDTWYPTTNHCIKREIIADFVDWYYPSYLEIKAVDYKCLSWYHERLFNVYIHHKKCTIQFMNGLRHIQSNSHNTFNTYHAVIPKIATKKLPPKKNKILKKVRFYKPTFRTFKKSEKLHSFRLFF